MSELVRKFSEWAESNGWKAAPADEKRGLPAEIVQRYAFIPSDWLEFVQCFDDIVNGEDNIWFLVPYNFADDSGGFRWNEFEMISLEAALEDKDEEWADEIRAFWDNHIPIVMSVAGDYHYYAIGVKTGEVFEGWEPEFEDVQICAMSFTDFINKIVSGKIILN